MIEIKVCGLRDNISEIVSINPDYVGLIFTPSSSRYVLGKVNSAEVIKSTARIRRVGVFVNQKMEEISALVDEFQLDILQLHGDENLNVVSEIKNKHPKIKIWKSIKVQSDADFQNISPLEGVIDRILLDNGAGGTGKAFDWELLSHYRVKIPFVLAGGISPDHVSKIKELSGRFPGLSVVDINSRFEKAHGMKDKSLVEKFILEMRQ